MQLVKYPRTYHLPWSPGATEDDKILHDLSAFEGQEIVITEKMDGENTTIYPDGYAHARSLDSGRHPSRSWVKSIASKIASDLADLHKKEWRITGENLYAKHSIHYKNLKSYFYMFGFWEADFCLEWDYTEMIAEDHNIALVPVLYQGPYDELLVRALGNTMREDQEGFVMRLARNIHMTDWNYSVAKWVREDHIQTDEHWLNQPIVKNVLE